MKRNATRIGALALASALTLTACGRWRRLHRESERCTAVRSPARFSSTTPAVETFGRGSTQTLFSDFTTETGVKVVDDYNEASTKFFAAAQNGASATGAWCSFPL